MALAMESARQPSYGKAPHNKKTSALHQGSSSSKRSGITGQPPFTKDTHQLGRELVYAMLTEQKVHLNGHTNGQVPPQFNSAEMYHVYRTMMTACRHFISQHGQELSERVRDLDISDSLLCTSYHQALHTIFEEDINWGRVVAMFCFTEALAYRVHKEGMSLSTIESLINWQTTFIVEHLGGWIVQQQGWVSLGMFNYGSNVMVWSCWHCQDITGGSIGMTQVHV